MIAEIETDKAVFELEAPGDGVLAGVKSSAGDMVPVGQTIAWIVARGETPPEDGAAEAAARAMKEQARPSAPSSAGPAPSPSIAASGAVSGAPKGPGRASPKARRIAEEHGIDISQVRGTGPDGSITGEDVLAAAAAAKQAPKPPGSAAPAAASTAPAASSTMSAVARLMAERTTQSWTHVAALFPGPRNRRQGTRYSSQAVGPAKYSPSLIY